VVLYMPSPVATTCNLFFQVCIRLELLGDVTVKVVTLGIATSIKYASLMGLSSINMSDLLLWTVRPVIMGLS
jgi:hypothetical protein